MAEGCAAPTPSGRYWTLVRRVRRCRGATLPRSTMKCPRCQQENPGQAKFCEQCGTRMAPICSSCGARLSATAKFCAECGHPAAPATAQSAARFATPESYTPRHLAEKILTSRSALEGERKQVTVLFADLKGSMELLADRDPEEARKLLDPGARADDGGRPPLRGHGEPGDGRRDHGALRRAARPRGPRRAGVLRRAPDAGVGRRDTPKGSAAPRASTVQIRVGLNSGEVVVRAIGSPICTWTTRRSGRRRISPPAWSSSATPGSDPAHARRPSQLAEGYVQVEAAGPGAGEGPARRRSRSTSSPARARCARGSRPPPRAASRGSSAATPSSSSSAGRSSRRATATARSSRSSASPASGSRGSSASSPTPTAPRAGSSWKRLGLLRQGDQLPARHRSPQGLLPDRRRETHRGDPREGDRQAPHARPGAEAHPARAAGPARCARRRSAVAGARSAATPPAGPSSGQAPPAAREPGPAAPRRLRGPPLDRLRNPGTARQPGREPADRPHCSCSSTTGRSTSHGWGSKTYYTQLRLDPLPPRAPTSCSTALLGHRRHASTPLKRLLIERTEGNPLFLEESVRTLVETRGPGRRAGRLSARPAARHHPGARHGAGDSGRADRSARRLRTSGSSRRRPSSARTCRFALLLAIADLAEEICAAGSPASRPPSSSTRRASFPTSNTPSSTPSPTRSPTEPAQRPPPRVSTLGSWRPSNELLRRTGSPSTSSGWRTTPSEARCGSKAVAYSARPAPRRSARSAYREALTFLEQALDSPRHLPESRDTLEQAHRSAARPAQRALGARASFSGILALLREAETLAATLGDQHRLGAGAPRICANISTSRVTTSMPLRRASGRSRPGDHQRRRRYSGSGATSDLGRAYFTPWATTGEPSRPAPGKT